MQDVIPCFLEFPVDVETLTKATALLAPCGFTPEEVSAFFLNMLVSHGGEILEAIDNGVPDDVVLSTFCSRAVLDVLKRREDKNG